MGLLFIGVVAGILIGFSWLGPSQGYHFMGCTWQGCFNRLAAAPPLEPQPAPFGSDLAMADAKSPSAVKSSKLSSANSRGRVILAKGEARPTRMSVSASDRRAGETSDAVLNKAKASVAAKLEVPASAEFSHIDRAFRVNTLGRATDTICGRVKGKSASGKDTGERPFLYLVKEDDAYVVDGKPDAAAAIAYRNICN
jgi:hypothetical protein